ncbi:MAG TPA: hypothetical protein PKY82_29795 [Pyrinomonadaceae bacterium]|nr:hypothetical protein [Pyrinomonadaceae bacterium]
MKNPNITKSIKALFAEIKNLKFEGFWSDLISIDRILITANFCPKCHRSLVYQGWSNPTEYRAYGICEQCEFAKLFWIETVQISSFKKKVCRMSAK